MSKKAKTWIYIGVIIHTIFMFSIVLLIFLFPLRMVYMDIPDATKIYYRIYKYENNTNIIYSDYGNVYYNNKLYDYGNDILWIDDNHLIYQKDSKYYYVDNDNTKELVFEDINVINHGSLLLRDNTIYFKYIETYYSYSVINDTLSTISKDNYYIAKDGNRYSVTAKEEDITTLTIKDNNTNNTKEITNKTLNKNKLVKSVNKVSKVRFFNYSIWDDVIYLHLYSDEYSIIVTYNLETEMIDYYDWFYREKSGTCYLAYKISSIDNIPTLKEIIK